MVVRLKYNFGDTLFIKNDPEQKEFILVGIHYQPGNLISLDLSYIGDIVTVYEFEVSETKDVLKKLLNDEKDES